MNIFNFSKAKAIFVPWPRPDETTVNQYGFYYAWDSSGVENNHRKTVIRLTARNVYRLYVNGTIVMHGPARTAHRYCRVDEIDITKYLNEEKNVIKILVWHWGESSQRYISGNAGLIFEINQKGCILAKRKSRRAVFLSACYKNIKKVFCLIICCKVPLIDL